MKNAGDEIFADKILPKSQFGNSLYASLTDNKIIWFGDGVL